MPGDGERERTHVRRSLKTSELVARRLVQDIVQRGLKPGDLLPPESAIVDQYDVGRDAVREAMRILEVNGIVSIRRGANGGPVVAETTPASMARTMTLFLQMREITLDELIESRIELETMLAGMAAEAVGKGRSSEALDERLHLGPSLGYSDVTFEFHERVCELAGDRTLSMIARALMHVFDSRVQDNVYPAREQGRVLGEHQAIAEAIRAGDADLARTLMRSHLESYRKSLRRRFSALIQRVIDWG